MQRSNLVDSLHFSPDGQVATNKTDITTVKGRLDTLESVSYTEITNEEILALFA